MLAAVLGGAASQALGAYTSFVAIALFFAFGFSILFSKEPPPVKECFLKAVASETALLRLVPKVFKRAGQDDHRIRDLLREESGHARTFRVLLKEKRLFQDDVNRDPRMCELSEKLTLPPGLLKKPFPETLGEIIRTEEAVRDLSAFWREHLSHEHHAGDALRDLVAGFEAEEIRHISFFTERRERERG